MQVSAETNTRIFNPRLGKALSWAGVIFGVGVGIVALVAGVSIIV